MSNTSDKQGDGGTWKGGKVPNIPRVPTLPPPPSKAPTQVPSDKK